MDDPTSKLPLYSGWPIEARDGVKPTISNPLPGTCGCGCSEPVRRRFKPGHDARLKATLLDVARRGDPRQSERATWQMIECGWSRFVDDAILHRLPERTSRGRRKLHIDQVERWIGEPVLHPGACHGRHHSRLDCPALTRSAKQYGQIHPITKLARPSWVQLVDTGPGRVEHLRQSWDLCEECTTVDLVFEQCERLWFRTMIGVVSLEHGLHPPVPMSAAQRSLSPKWTVDDDLESDPAQAA